MKKVSKTFAAAILWFFEPFSDAERQSGSSLISPDNKTG
jgi:hypothetical protein